MDAERLENLVQACPKLEQLGISLKGDDISTILRILAMLPRLSAVRILPNTWLYETLDSLRSDHEARRKLTQAIGRCAQEQGTDRLQWFAVGSEVLRVGTSSQTELDDEEKEIKKEAMPATIDDVQHLKIWSMDCLEL